MKLTRQYDSMDCGPACVRMVAEHYGKKYPLVYLRNHAYLSREGVSIAGIRSSFNMIGCNAKSFEMSLKVLNNKCPLPAILFWEQKHFVVLYKIKKSHLNKNVFYYIADPAYGKHKFSEAKFTRYWQNGESGIAVVVEPTEKFYQQIPPSESHNIFSFIKEYISPFKSEIFQIAVGLLGGVLLALITPFLTQALIDNGIGQKDYGIIFNLLIAQLCLFAGGFIMDMIRSWIVLRVGTKVNIRIISDFLSKMMKLPINFFDTKSMGDYEQRINDHYRLETFTTSDSLRTIFSLFSCIVFFVVIGFYDITVLSIYLLFTFLSTNWMIYYLKKRKSLDYELFRLRTENQNAIFEMINGVSDIKLNNFQNSKLHEWKHIQDRLYGANLNVLKVDQKQEAGFSLLNQTRNIVVTFWIAVAVVKGELTLGMMMSISYIIGQINSPLSQLINFVRSLQDAKISLERSEEVHLCENEDNKTSYLPLPQRATDIEINNVTYKYEGPDSESVLKDISILIPKGKTTAIVGESGSGKTTLLKLLLKFYQPTSGIIKINKHQLCEYSANEWRMMCGIVMQENYIFSDTIEANIILGDEKQKEKRLKEAIKIACLNHFIENLPLGIRTKIGPQGNSISGGERQRIMIARAIYKHPEYLFLDEATSSLDAENEHLIVENLERFCNNRTVVIIAHRLSTVKNADQIIVLKKGRVVEKGNHKQLIAKGGEYYNLVKNQLELSAE